MATATAEKLTQYSITEATLMGSARVDRENCLIHGVKFLGSESRNKRRYSEQAIAAADKDQIYVGSSVYINHPGKNPANGQVQQNRRYEDRFARVESQERNGLGISGSLKYNPKHPLAEAILWDIENKTPGVGMSHNILGSGRPDGQGEIIEHIDRVRSLDIVDGPATTKSFLEQEDGETTVKAVLEAWVAAIGDEARSKPITEMLADPTMGAAMAAMPMQQPQALPAANPDMAIKAGIRTAVLAAFDDPSLDSAETIARIQSLLAAQDSALGKPPANPEKPGEPGVDQFNKDKGKGVMDDKDKARVEQAEKRSFALEALATNGVPVKSELVKELMEQADLDAMDKAVKSWAPAKRGAAKPAIKSVFEQKSDLDKYPTGGVKDFVAAGRRR